MKKLFSFLLIFIFTSIPNILGKIEIWNLTGRDCVFRYRPGESERRFIKQVKIPGKKMGLEHVKTLPDEKINAWIVEIPGKDGKEPLSRSFAMLMDGNIGNYKIYIEFSGEDSIIDGILNRPEGLPKHIRCNLQMD